MIRGLERKQPERGQSQGKSPTGTNWATRTIDRVVFGGLVGSLLVVPVQSYPAQVGGLLVIVLLFLWLMARALQKEVALVWTWIHTALVGFLLFTALQLYGSSFWDRPGPSLEGTKAFPALAWWQVGTLDPAATVDAVIMLAVLVGYFFLLCNAIDHAQRLRVLVTVLTVAGFLIATLELSNRLSPENDPFIYRSESLGVVLGFDFHPVQYVGFIEMILPVPLAMVLGRGLRRDQAFLFGFMAIAMGVMLVTSNTTGGVLIVGLELVVLVLLHQWKRRLGPAARRRLGTGRLALVVSVVVLGIVGGLWWVGHRSVPQMVSSDLTRELQGITASGPEQINNRMKIWMTTLEIIKDYPVFGVGLGGMPAAYTRYDHSPGLVQMNAAHNDWLQLLSETGLVGGVLLVLFLIFLARLGKTSFIMGDGLGQSIGLGATVGCVGIIAHSLFDFYLQSPANIWFFVTLLGVLVGVVRVVETKEAYE